MTRLLLVPVLLIAVSVALATERSGPEGNVFGGPITVTPLGG